MLRFDILNWPLTRRDERGQARPAVAMLQLGRRRSAGDCAALAAQRVESMLGHLRFDRRQLEDLPSTGLGVAAAKSAVAYATVRGHVFESRVDLVRRQQRPLGLLVALLPSAMAPAARFSRPSRACLGVVPRRRHRRVQRVQPLPRSQLPNELLLLGDLRRLRHDDRLEFGDPGISRVERLHEAL
jgi:hypothetical protein